MRNKVNAERGVSLKKFGIPILITVTLISSILSPAIMTGNSVSIHNHDITFISHTYNATTDISTWTYSVTSGSHPSISHWIMELGECIDETDIVDASEEYEFMDASHPDPTTGSAGIKFDDGYEDGEHRIVWFKLKGDYPEGNIKVGIKAGRCVNYGYVTGPACPYSISGRVWHDMFHSKWHQVDGIQDDGEPGLQGILIELYDVHGNLIEQTTTDENGSYCFKNLLPGWYKVKVADANFQNGSLKGWYASPKDRGNDDTKDSDGNDDHEAWANACNCATHIDFGFFYACISLQKTGPMHAMPGQQITYHFVVKNCGDVVLHGGAHVYDELLSPCSDHQIWEHVVWPGEVYEFNKSYVIPADYCGWINNTAIAEGYPRIDFDCCHHRRYPNVYDESSWNVRVICSHPSIEIEKKVWNESTNEWEKSTDAYLGEIVRFNISVHNDGNENLSNINITDYLPAWLHYAGNATVDGVAIEPTTWGNNLTWLIDSLSPSNTTYIEFDAKVTGCSLCNLISFLIEDNFTRVDGNTSSWSTGDNMVDLG
ncbi:MAG: DUF11 domain-containing protein, partial [Thermoplasmata archaeon]|nr:DUF11 domain-containing protein [Thermoplasmata archaeon]